MGNARDKGISRQKRVNRIRKKINGTAEKPRLRVFKSAKHIYAQLIDDEKANTLASMCTLHQQMLKEGIKGKTAQAKKVGLLIAEAAKAVGVDKVVFDRGGYIYHGRVKALSEGAREGGLVF